MPLAQTPTPAPGVLEPKRPDLEPLPEARPAPTPPPAIETPSVPPPSPPTVVPETTIQVKEIRVLGSTIFSKSELDAVVEPFINQPATFEDLLAIRTAVTDFYTRKGYTTSGAFLPPQDISSGVIKIQVVEGELERVDIQGLRRLRESYVRSRVGQATRPPLNINRLEAALKLLQLDPLLKSVQAELTAGTTLGQSVLKLNLQEAPALVAELLVENRDSPSVGSVRGTASLGHRNLLGFGDRFLVSYGRSKGIREFEVSYAIPLNARNGTLSLRYDKNKSEIVEQPFSELDINSNAETFSIGFRQPLLQTSTHEFALGLSLDLRQSQTYLFGDEPFSFSEGPIDGRSKVSVLRFSQDWVSRNPNRVLAARSQFSLGLNAFDATINDTGTDGRFLSWVGQFQWVQALSRDVLAIARVSAQVTGDSLLPIEQFSIGGPDTVRGYRQNQRVGDAGIVGSLELRLPIIRQPDGIGTVELAPFFDIGQVRTNRGELPPPTTLMSLGIELRWQSRYVDAQLSWGIPLKDVDQVGNTLQDKGIFFSITFHPF